MYAICYNNKDGCFLHFENEKDGTRVCFVI